MKKLFPFLLALLLLSSCQQIKDFFGCDDTTIIDDTDLGNEDDEMESYCEDNNDGEVVSYIFSIDPGENDVDDIDTIQFTYTFSYNGVEPFTDTIVINKDYQIIQNLNPGSGDNYSIDFTILPNGLFVQNGNGPLDVAEIMIDMPGLPNSSGNCETFTTDISNVAARLANGDNIELNGCIRTFDDCTAIIL